MTKTKASWTHIQRGVVRINSQGFCAFRLESGGMYIAGRCVARVFVDPRWCRIRIAPAAPGEVGGPAVSVRGKSGRRVVVLSIRAALKRLGLSPLKIAGEYPVNRWQRGIVIAMGKLKG